MKNKIVTEEALVKEVTKFCSHWWIDKWDEYKDSPIGFEYRKLRLMAQRYKKQKKK